ncbi:hypothetical protein JCM9279_001627 [Rhodotorula babjevae]
MSPLSSQYVESDDDSSHSPAPKASSSSSKKQKKAKRAVQSDSESSEDKPLAKQPKKSSSKDQKKERKARRDDDSDSPAPKPKAKAKDKKRKRTDDSQKDKKPVRKVGEARRATGEALTDDGGNSYVDLGANKRVVVSDFKGKTLVQIREYYNDNGEWKPGKKGIALPVDAWDRLKKAVGTIDTAIDDLVG